MNTIDNRLKDISKNCGQGGEGSEQCNQEITKTNNAFANFKKVFDLRDIANLRVAQFDATKK